MTVRARPVRHNGVMSAGSVGTVVLAIVTFRRAAELAALLPEVLNQVAENSGAGTRFQVLVVDNDASGSARSVVGSLTDDRVRYVVEATPGIAAARNRALSEASDAEVLVFIDDDERPEPQWLRSLINTYQVSGADAVSGAVISAFSGVLDDWIIAGNFFGRRRLATGSKIEVAATNNLLLNLHTVREMHLVFDERFGQSGGSDTLFTRALVSGGGRMVWCNEAVVIDHVPTERMTRQWVLLRALRSGNSWSRTSLALTAPGARRLLVRIELTAHSAPRLLGGFGRFLLGSLTRSPAHQARGLRTLARGSGMLLGAFGYTYREYRRPAS
jgi:succinoglycan biosynthesis protein ExoM